MSIDLDGRLVETAQKVATTINEFGDTDYGSSTPRPCLYRDISMLNQAANRREVQIDGILWFGAGEDVTRGDVYYHPSEGNLKITKVTRAKTLLTDDTVKFIRTEVVKERQIS